MRRTISFLHAADLHLDSPFKGFTQIPEEIFSEIRQSTFNAYDQLIDTAINKQVDFVLLVGDLFDNERQSLKAQLHLKRGFERLEKEGIAVFLSYGNHDHLQGNIHPIDYPANVFIFPSETVTSFTFKKNNTPLAEIYGFSYENRAVTGNKTAEYEKTNASAPYHIAMLHGSLYGDETHDAYAPFRLQDLQKEAFDYWALGHIHKREVLQLEPPVVYPGNIQGRHRNELGEKGCYYVEMNGDNVDIEFVPLQAIIFQQEICDLTDCMAMSDIEQQIARLYDEVTVREFIHLTCTSTEAQIAALGLEERLEELIDVLNEEALTKHAWQYIYSVQIVVLEERKIVEDAFFIGEIKQAFKEISFREEVKDLYRHRIAKKHIEPIDEKEMMQKAEKWLADELFEINKL